MSRSEDNWKPSGNLIEYLRTIDFEKGSDDHVYNISPLSTFTIPVAYKNGQLDNGSSDISSAVRPASQNGSRILVSSLVTQKIPPLPRPQVALPVDTPSRKLKGFEDDQEHEFHQTNFEIQVNKGIVNGTKSSTQSLPSTIQPFWKFRWENDWKEEEKYPTSPDPDPSPSSSTFGCRHPPEATRLLTLWYDAHTEFPYPTKEEKEALAGFCGLSMVQISYWFSNRRARLLRNEKKREKRRRKASDSN